MARKRIAALLALIGCAVAPSCAVRAPVAGPRDSRSAFPAPSSVRIVSDIVYATYGSRRLSLDLYLPADPPRGHRLPGVIVVRGGGWQSGDKETFGFMAAHLAEAGFAAASVSYRTSQEAKFPAAVEDVKAAVRWMRAHADAYAIDPDAIGALGASAGGHLVTMLATSAGVSDLEGAGGNRGTSSGVQAAVALACVCSMEWRDPAVAEFLGAPPSARPDIAREASPGTYVGPRSAPLLLLHSRTDPLVPFKLSRRMEALYLRAGASATLVPIDAPHSHAFWNEARYFPETMDRTVAFLRSNLSKAP